MLRLCACCAAEREQAPSPQGCVVLPLSALFPYPTLFRSLAPAGVRSAPKPAEPVLPDPPHAQASRLLRTPAGASSLATGLCGDQFLCGLRLPFVARALAPAGVRSAPKPAEPLLPDTTHAQALRLLRSRAGASSLSSRLCGAPSLCALSLPDALPISCSRWGA